MRLFEKLCRVRAERAGFGGRALNQEWPANSLLVLAHRIEQVERVLRPHVVRVAFEGALKLGAALGCAAYAHQLDAELRARAPETRRELDGATPEIHAVRVAASDDRKMRERVEQLSRARVDR